MNNPKQMVVVGGPNGSGKSTFADEYAMNQKSCLNQAAFRRALVMQKIGNAAVHKAQARNRAKGIANFIR